MPILHLHRRGLYLVERAQVRLWEDRVVYAAAGEDGSAGLVRSWNVPTLNTNALLLGQGSSLSQPAARRLQADEVSVAFVGSGGTPFLLASQDYRPGERLQRWIVKWPDPEWRLRASKRIQEVRTQAVPACWAAYRKAAEGRFKVDPTNACEDFGDQCRRALSIEQLMGFEGAYMKELYKAAARASGVTWAERRPGDGGDRANRFLDRGNYLAYGLASAVLWAYGLPTSLPVTHGASRAGGLVFDVADAIKDAVILPTAFQCAADAKCSDQAFRELAVERLHGATPLDPANGTLGYLFRLVDALLDLPAATS